MGGGVVGSAVGITFSSGETPASDTPRLLPEKMFTSLTKKETNTIRLKKKKQKTATKILQQMRNRKRKANGQGSFSCYLLSVHL